MESWKSFLFVAFLTSSAYFGNVECRRMRRLVLSTKKVFQRSAAVHLPSSYDDDVSTTRILVMESAIGYTHIPLLDAELKTTTETIRFKPMPANLSLSEDQEIKLNCSITLPGVHTDNHNIHWWKDGKALSTSQRIILNVANSGGTVIGTCSIPRIQRVDAGKYVCRLSLNGTSIESDPVNIQVEGLPFFLRNPEQLNVTQSTPFNLTCEAVGPPDPVAIYWFENSRKISDKADNSFSVLTWPGITETTRFSCEAHNVKGLSSSTTAVIHVKELPSSPSDVKVMNQTAHNVLVSWVPGFDGYSFFINCAIKVKMDSEDEEYAYTHNVSVPPHEYMIQQLQAMSQYHVSVACRNEIGWSNASQWILFNTTEGAPSAPPQNVTLSVIGTVLHVAWSEPPEEKLNGFLLGYKLVYKLESTTLDKSESIFLEKIEHEAYVNITTNATYIVQVAAVTGGGTGPLSDPKQVSVPEEPSNSRRNSTSVILGVVCGITGLILAVCLFMVTRKRILKMTKFRRIFGSNEELEPAVRYKAKKSYTRRAIEISLNNLGVSEDLQQKLQDVMIARNLLSLGKVLGEGEFGSVVEGNLKQPNGSNQKVAVKTMKLDSFSQREIEEFLSEAACMKDFNHPNVIKLLGVCLDANSRQTPRPMVILPFMKFGDLHSFLLRSRLGDNCQFLPVQTLLKFMIDIAQGMEYLSSRNFLHRDLAARNCMLRDDMTVCVADFGLSKKIYSGDYYRQGRIAKMPVKWISIESLADRIFTTKSDVWAFGVTMWEIETRGMTPYPGVQNHEIYDYLLEGHRLKQPDDCLDELYRIMYSCWSVDPLERPTFTELKISLEKLLEGLPYVRDKDDIIYINTSMPEEEDSATEYSRFHSPNDITGLCAKEHSRSTITVDVHETMDPEERYIVPIPSEDQGNISAQFDTPLLQSDIPHHIRPVPQELQPANGLESIHDFSEDSVIML